MAVGQKVEFTSRMKAAVNDIAQLRYPEFRQKLKAERSLNPQNRVADYLEAGAICIDLFLNEDEQGFKEKEPRLDYLIARIEELPAAEKYRDVMLGEIYLGKASLQGKFKNTISAGWLFYKAYNHLQNSARKNPDFIPNHLSWGVLNAAIGSLPDDYRNIASMLGFSGNINTGMKLVRTAYDKSVSDSKYAFYRPYYGYVYVFLNHQLQGTEKIDLQQLGIDVKSSSLFIYLQSEVLLSRGESRAAFQLLQHRPEGPEYLRVPYLDYITGKVGLSLNAENTPAFFIRYLNRSQTQDYFKSTYRYLSWYYLINNDLERSNEMRARIFSTGKTTMGADEQALNEATRGFNRKLIQRRLDFDAGFYKKVIDEPEQEGLKNCCTANWEKLEYFYRRGRAYQELAMNDAAIDAYLKALSFKDAEMTYALGNSYLQLGVLYEKRSDAQKARYFYTRALEIKGYPFYEGIHQKAKTAISRL